LVFLLLVVSFVLAAVTLWLFHNFYADPSQFNFASGLFVMIFVYGIVFLVSLVFFSFASSIIVALV
jgi:hypothetical protein